MTVKNEFDHPELVKVSGIKVMLDGQLILSGTSLQLNEGERLALMGPSGIGKSTLLKTIAGLIIPAAGSVMVPERISYVFDDHGLYPRLSARENIELGVNWASVSRAERKTLAVEYAGLFDCLSFLDQKAETLSAGQRKRTALAQAMMKKPQLLLLDETFHALDPQLRLELMNTLLHLQKKLNFGLIFATHDGREAKRLNARIQVLGLPK